MAASPMSRGNLAAALLWAADWCNDALLAALVDAGWPRFTKTQSLVFARLGERSRRPADLAREVGVTRQSMQALLEPLLAADILWSRDDPDDGRATLVELGPRGHELAVEVSRLLAQLTDVLGDRIGENAVDALFGVLSLPWGPVPEPGDLTSAKTS